jgi:AmmeMemoRadiSam system protein B
LVRVFALRGAVELARQRGWAIRMLNLRTSSDIAGDPTRVVGYGTFAIAGG